MFKRLAVLALVLGALLATARSGAKTYTFLVREKAAAGNTELKPGEYYLKLAGSQVVVTDEAGKQVDVTATVETADHKFDQTALHCATGDGTNRLVSIELGGSTYKVVFQ